jgi:hypothetical protein
MKKLFLILAIGSLLSSCQETEDPSESTILSKTELETLLFTREEEKMAHDVYWYASQKYGVPIFENIARSEISHTQAVLNLMAKYSVTDPLDGSTLPGQFTNPVLAQLYRKLTERADVSLASAMEVGLYIEDLDIRDLDQALTQTQRPDLIQVYENLRCGSTNHLRSFENLASGMGITYTPEFISQSEYTAIINADMSKCAFN